MMIIPESITDIVGVIIVAAMFALNYMRNRKEQEQIVQVK